jgi:hypothetical protein
MISKSKVKIVYLDQKCWIDIAKMHYGKSSPQERKLIQKIFVASEKCRAIFPLSISHLEETMCIRDEERRNRLAFLMAKISRGYGFQPYVTLNIRNEVRNIVLKRLGLPTLDIRGHVLNQGIPHLLGAKAELRQRKDATSQLPEEIKRKLLNLLESPEALEFALKQRRPKSIDRDRKGIVTTMEINRKGLSQIKDNDLRKRIFLAKNMGEIVVPELAKILYECKLPKDLITKEKPSRRDIYELLDNIPSALCLFTLIYQRDQQLQRSIKTNDTNDIWFLTLALPYSDIVVTEKMWTSIARQTHLDRKCNTIVLSSVNALEEYL